MAWWDEKMPVNQVQPVTIERVQNLLETEGYNVGLADSGDHLQASFNGFNTIFALENDGTMLLVRSWLGRDLDETLCYATLSDWINRCHSAQYFPKTYMSTDEDGLQVYSEVYTPCQVGFTDNQLTRILGVSLETIVTRLADTQELLGIQPEAE